MLQKNPERCIAKRSRPTIKKKYLWPYLAPRYEGNLLNDKNPDAWENLLFSNYNYIESPFWGKELLKSSKILDRFYIRKLLRSSSFVKELLTEIKCNEVANRGPSTIWIELVLTSSLSKAISYKGIYIRSLQILMQANLSSLPISYRWKQLYNNWQKFIFNQYKISYLY